MKKQHSFANVATQLLRQCIYSMLTFFFLNTPGHTAATPLFSFTPLTPTSISVPKNQSASVRYVITNNSSKSHTLVFIPPSNNAITQRTTGASTRCKNPFTLPSKGSSCILSLVINGSQLNNSTPICPTPGNPTSPCPVVCQQGSSLECYRPSANNVIHTTSTTNTYSVGGSISGLIGTVVLQINGNITYSTATDGQYAFPTQYVSGTSYRVTVLTQPATQICTVSNATGTIHNSNVTDVNVTCSTNAYPLGGTVTGLGTGLSFVLVNHGIDDKTITANAPYTFSDLVAEGSPYLVTVKTQPTNQTCSVSNASGTMGSAPVTNVNVHCDTTSFYVGGTVSNLANGESLVLKNNGTNDTPITTNGPFTFSQAVANGATYNVTVSKKPVSQNCTVTNGSGTIAGAPVTNVQINCTTANTTLTVSPSLGTIPSDGSISTVFTITNSGSTNNAQNVTVVLPNAWSNVVPTYTGCSSINPQSSCTVSFATSSNVAYVANGAVQITGDNITNPPTIALAFTVGGYDVFAIPSAGTALVLASSPLSTVIPWSINNVLIHGITDQSSIPCAGATDGLCNTGRIVSYYATPYANYAAGGCYGIVSDNSGTVPLGTWYLPAVCQMIGPSTDSLLCGSGTPNIQDNLAQYGFLGGNINRFVWSSTEDSTNPQYNAWNVAFDNSTQAVVYGVEKTNLNGSPSAWCVRSIGY